MARLTPIRLALLQSNHTQKWFADQLDVSEPVASRIVNGLVPDDATVVTVCRVLNRPESVLFPHLSAGSDHTPVSTTPSSELEAA